MDNQQNDKDRIEEWNAKEEQKFEDRFQNDLEAFCDGRLPNETLANETPFDTLTFEELENKPRGDRVPENLYNKARARAYFREHHRLTDYEAFLDRKQDAVRILDKDMRGLNKILNGGISYGKLYALGADTSLGKTAFSLQLVKALANQNFPTLYFALEMDTPEIDAILLSNQSYIMAKEENKDLTSISNNGDYNEIEKKYNLTNGYTLTRQDAFSSLLKRQIEELQNEQTDFLKRVKTKYKEIRENIFLMDTQAIKLAYPTTQISAKEITFLIENFIEEYNIIPFVVIDYLQLLTYEGIDNNKVLSTSKNVSELKEFALAKNVPIWVISSLNRAGNKQPIQLESFKESGDIEYTADIVLGLQLKYFEEYFSWLLSRGLNDKQAKAKINDYYHNSLSKETRSLEIVSIKNRQGERFQKLEIEYNPAYNNIEVSNYYSLKNKTNKQKATILVEHINKMEEKNEDTLQNLITSLFNNQVTNRIKQKQKEEESDNDELMQKLFKAFKNASIKQNQNSRICILLGEAEEFEELPETAKQELRDFYDDYNSSIKGKNRDEKMKQLAKIYIKVFCQQESTFQNDISKMMEEESTEAN